MLVICLVLHRGQHWKTLEGDGCMQRRADRDTSQSQELANDKVCGVAASIDLKCPLHGMWTKVAIENHVEFQMRCTEGRGQRMSNEY